ncbi:MAG: tetratricopeptide repeat protein [Armatimonadia bacterium]
MHDERTGEPSLEEQLSEVLLLVERRNLDRAQELAQRLLLHYPNNAPVHAAMAEVASARHEHREAIEWFELALRLEPSQRWRERLSRERDLLDETRLAGFEEARPRELDKRKLLIAGIGGLLLLVLAIALIAGLSGGGQRGEGARAGGRVRPSGRAGAPAGEQPAVPKTTATAPGRTVAGGRPATQAGTTSPTLTPTPTTGAETPRTNMPPVRITQNVEAPMSDRDVLLTRALAGLTWPSGKAAGQDLQAVLDPFTGYSMITVKLPTGTSRADIYGTVIDMAWKLAVAATRSDDGVDAITIRVLADIENDQRRQSTLVAFRANTSREAVDYYLKRSVQPDRQTLWNHVFATVWWNPSVPAGGEAKS